MKLIDILRSKSNAIISRIGPDDLVKDAVRIMCENRIGSLLVQDSLGNPIGLITERDVMLNLHKDHENYVTLRVSDVMTKDLICGLATDGLDYIMKVMTHNRIRHLPVVADNKIIGIISIGDVLHSMLEDTRVQNHKLHDYLELSGQL